MATAAPTAAPAAAHTVYPIITAEQATHLTEKAAKDENTKQLDEVMAAIHEHANKKQPVELKGCSVFIYSPLSMWVVSKLKSLGFSVALPTQRETYTTVSWPTPAFK